MALKTLTPLELAHTRTLFRSFMGRSGTRHRTVGELLAIYRERCGELRATGDPDDDLRVDRFMREMVSGTWRDGLVMRIGEFDGSVHLIDGTHRGIAYLACREGGVGGDRLPALTVDC
ncbi:MAG TPA: hypothetical protein VLZ06_03600 [Solirubrobacteraceae bacterium]|nr:hypothetical protein [Solirubrobacteraceae bacterium]